ncbi:MAG: formyl-CoA transferase, partial [Variovorax sp.]|nr:formyl-CoA transferase [Variovorax sp.]
MTETNTTTYSLAPAALAGLRVVEMGQLIAGPFCGKTLGEFGADIVKIEPPA